MLTERLTSSRLLSLVDEVESCGLCSPPVFHDKCVQRVQVNNVNNVIRLSVCNVSDADTFSDSRTNVSGNWVSSQSFDIRPRQYNDPLPEVSYLSCSLQSFLKTCTGCVATIQDHEDLNPFSGDELDICLHPSQCMCQVNDTWDWMIGVHVRSNRVADPCLLFCSAGSLN